MGGEVVVVVVEDVVDVDATVDSGGVEAIVDDESGFVSADAFSEFDPEQPAAKIRVAHSRIPLRPPTREMARERDFQMVRPLSNDSCTGS
jgi:hypothetical protein